MQPRSIKHLSDILDAARFVVEITTGRTSAHYDQDRLLRNAVERNFEIIGEALNRLRREDAETVGRISDFDRIIAFRNVLAHGYDIVNHEQVWKVIQQDVPRLLAEVQRLLPQ